MEIRGQTSWRLTKRHTQLLRGMQYTSVTATKNIAATLGMTGNMIEGVDTATDPIARFQYRHLATQMLEVQCRIES